MNKKLKRCLIGLGSVALVALISVPIISSITFCYYSKRLEQEKIAFNPSK